MLNPSHVSVINRVSAALFGGYAFAWGFAAFFVAGLVGLGIDFHEAETAAMLLAFILYLCLFIWAFAAANLARVWTVLGGGAVLMVVAAWGLQHYLVS